MSVKLNVVKQGKTERYTFGSAKELIKVPPLLEIQKKSYKDFLEKGIKSVLDEFFPLTDYSGKAKLYITEILPFAKPKYDIKECKRRGATYSSPLRLRHALLLKKQDRLLNKMSLWVTCL